ncbi:uncharacterized protein LOC107044644 [Diachasma alloeum]|uniref:uncharacterized protein LOC107044644 n=1 Tax=Diachasma alloeum TaxID=454923 RepID=UPI00073824BC|nr:uncharacterized protein LOC107044644 [Diachasma alloeum]
MRKELNDTRTAIQEINSLKQKVEALSSDILACISENQLLKNKIALLEKNEESRERRERSKNIIISGIDEEISSCDNLKDWLTNELNVDAKVDKVVTIKTTSRRQTILATLGNMEDKNKANIYQAELQNATLQIPSDATITELDATLASTIVKAAQNVRKKRQTLKKKDFLKRLQDDLLRANDTKTFWKIIGKFRRKPFTQCPTTAKTWEEFYTTNNLITPMADVNLASQDVVELDSYISCQEITQVLKNLKAGKSPVPDGIENNFYKHLIPNMIEAVTELFNRGSQVSAEREAAKTTSSHLTLKSQWPSVKRRRLLATFVDYKRAFDEVDHQVLWQQLDYAGVSTRLIKVLSNFYGNAKTGVRISSDEKTKSSSITQGVLQGDPLSPILFILLLHDMATFFRSREHINVEKKMELLLFADDGLLLSDDIVDMQYKLNTLAEYDELNKMTLNTEKTKVMIFSKGGRPPKLRTLRYRGLSLEIVKKYVYLGVPFTPSGFFNHALDHFTTRAKLVNS